MSFRVVVMLLLSLCVSFGVKASETAGMIDASILDLTATSYGFIAIAIFVIAYVFVILEEKLHLRKSKPVLLAAGIIWILIAVAYLGQGEHELVAQAIRHNFLEYSELFFFLLVAMTYINAMLERGVFDALRDVLVSKGLSYRSLFWLTGILAFFISPIADNLTTALVMCAVVMAVGKDEPKFIGIACINIVVAANAGGAFSPFGDITTLMVWQKGILEFWTFFDLFVPSAVNFIVPAVIMSFALPKGIPSSETNARKFKIKQGGLVIVGLFLATIVTAISFHLVLHMPPVFGMMTGFAYLKLFAFFLKQQQQDWEQDPDSSPGSTPHGSYGKFDIFNKIAQAEWDTLFFFYGVILAVGGLGFMGYLGLTSEFMYGQLGALNANILVGILSAIVDNIPVMFAVLTMNPEMSEVQWLLVTLTAGVGGSLLSIGSAAGVALMGQARGHYTFFVHLKWTPAIALGYAASIAVHMLLNG
ncbi:sodium:proton antiporter NhaD [Brumicola nitratireducens]|uniref:Na+/H+ antiporter NhaD n=1 Tax=Glaciecola nitratireducens (strain JCM 12485 / KCTC 12276 / FR1064) TaxID=1085623 RepID=G4QDQ9_GLANF|nr:sodium:proton antiporter NhaD [Glaciecola nitratireducens]AEP31088.1 Na+/H+ antiporter NhaD [Glaciecola nitratireducens FR1064]